jgi:hypothetical protein
MIVVFHDGSKQCNVKHILRRRLVYITNFSCLFIEIGDFCGNKILIFPVLVTVTCSQLDVYGRFGGDSRLVRNSG